MYSIFLPSIVSLDHIIITAMTDRLHIPVIRPADPRSQVENDAHTSGKWAFGLDPLVPAVIWDGTKGPATSPQICPPAWELLVPARYETQTGTKGLCGVQPVCAPPLVPVCVLN
jgi:hypothetical protein